MTALPSIAGGPPVYRGMTQDALDSAYDNRAYVADSAACLARWAEMSWNLYQEVEVYRDLQYGPAPRQRLDFFPARSAGRPTMLFIHGGYWQWCDKEDECFVARGPLAHDINVAVVEYTLCPDIDLDGMVGQMHAAVDWLIPNLPAFDADPGRLVLAGSSAGAHLAAMLAGRPDVRGTLLISGLYELEPVRLTRLNGVIGMDRDSARRNSPILQVPKRAGPACFTIGDDELPEMTRQSLNYHSAWTAQGLPGRLLTVPDANHFTVMDSLADPDGHLTAAILELCRTQMSQNP